MKPISFDRTCYWIDDTPTYLNSGEFHYFRVPRADWARRMALFKAAGGNCLATYIPWLLHEPEEGSFVFDAGDGVTDLEAFLQTAEEAELYVVARPGPYQYSELIYGGLPEWLFEKYPQIQAHTRGGEPFGLPSVSYLHPVFLDKVRTWFGAVCPIIARHTVRRGGSVAFTQFDNELMGIHVWFGGLDYNREAMGIGSPEGRYPRFLEDRYGGIVALNAAYDTAYAGFEMVEPIAPGDAPAGMPSGIRRLKDYFDFYAAAITEYARLLCGLMRDYGIDTPFVHNSANPGMNAYFTEMAKTFGSGFLLGSDHYYNLSQSWPQNNPTPQYARNVFLSNEQLRLLGYPPTILELPSGSASDWPPITARDAVTCYMTNLALGMKGHNYYIFTGGPNPRGVGETTDSYDYGAPIGAMGQIRPLYGAQGQFGKFITDHPWLVQARRAYDCRLGLSFEYARADRYWQDSGGSCFTGLQAWRFTAEGLLTSALCTSLSPICVDLDADDWVGDTSTPLLIASAESMAQAQQERIVSFLENAGNVLIAPVLPRLDEALKPCSTLADYLGAPPARLATEHTVRVMIEGRDRVVTNVLKNAVFYPEAAPRAGDVCAFDERTGAPIGWQMATPGGGSAIILGLTWDHRKSEQSDMLLALSERLGLQRRVMCSNPNVWTSLRYHNDRGILFLMNLFTSPMEAVVSFRTSSGSHVDMGEQCLEAMSVKALEVIV
jgi:beta-galactosidase